MEYIDDTHKNTVQYFGFTGVDAFMGVDPKCVISLLQTPQFCVELCYNEGTTDSIHRLKFNFNSIIFAKGLLEMRHYRSMIN